MHRGLGANARRLVVALVAAALVGVTGTGAASATPSNHRFQPTPPSDWSHPRISARAPKFRDGTVLVGFDASVSPVEQQRIMDAANARESEVIGVGTHLWSVPPGRVAAVVSLLLTIPGVRYAEPDYLARPAATPNDPSFSKQWAYQNTGQAVNGIAGTAGADERATNAWATTTGSSSIVIGEVDTGVDYNHPDLAANIWRNPGGIGGCPAGTHGYNFVAWTCDPMDDEVQYGGHGTHVAGILGAVGNNGTGVTGVNWTTTILPVKWVDASGWGATSQLIAALDWLVQAKQAGVNVRVVNDSDVFFGSAYSQALSDEIDLLGQNNILFVTAGGNTSDNNDNPALRRYPCAYERTNEICAMASNQNDARPSWANYGATTVDIAAPGDNIYSTLRNATYGTVSGSSMAAPQVAGTAALILSRQGMSATQLKADILETVDRVPALAGVVRTGGRLNTCNALPGCSASTAPTAPFAVTPPAITGAQSQPANPSPEPQQGQVLSASPGSWDGGPTAYAYLWRRCTAVGTSCTAIAGATNSTYTVTVGDIGSTLQVAVTATGTGGSTTATSPPTMVVQVGAPPTTFGKTAVGGTTDPAGANWERVNVAQLSQTGAVTKLSIYLQRWSSGSEVLQGVLHADQNGAPGSLVAASSPVTFGAASTSGWYDLPFAAPVALQPGTYWMGLLTGATGNAFALRYDDSTARSSAVAPQSYSNGPLNPFGAARFDTEQMSIYATYNAPAPPPVPPPAPMNTALPSITGTARQGSTLTAAPGSWANNPTSFGYQWSRCAPSCAVIAGATSTTYTPVAPDVGTTLVVAVTASNAGGSSTATSATTATVTAAPTGGTFGLTTVGANSDTMLGNRKRVNRFQVSTTGTVTKLTMYLAPTATGGSQVLNGVIYADQGGAPGTLLAVSNQLTFSSTNAAGWYDLTLPSALPVSPGWYWIGVFSGGTDRVTGFRWNSLAGARNYNANIYANGPSNPFGTPTVDSEQMSIYATYS